jgi:hypothetical protein
MSTDVKITRMLARRSELNPTGGPQAAWTAIAHANRIFGPQGWSREVLEMRNAANREREGVNTSAYVARVRLTVNMPDGPVIRDSHGCGEGRGRNPFEAHDQGLKAAELDATLRALATFGNAFGLAVFSGAGPSKTPRKKARTSNPNPDTPGADSGSESGSPPNLPAPDNARPPRSEGPEQGEEDAEQTLSEGSGSSPVVPPDYDYSAMMAPKLRRVRSPAHLGFVRAQPCLICGRTPSDAHHLRFVQPRAMARKVSDEFTVPLCRRHHDLLHRDPDEQGWWQAFGIDPLVAAAELWEESRQLVSASGQPG